MSKRIISYGEDSIVTCNICGCKFVFEKEDIITKEDGTTKVVTCPFCKADTNDYGPAKIPMGGNN